MMDMIEEKPESEASEWLAAIKLSGKRQKTWERKGEKIVDRYRDERSESDESKRFNILWSNVETLKPALYSQQPKPQVMRRYKDKDPIGKAAAEVLERAIDYSMDAYDFDAVIDSSVQDYLLPGRGVARVKYKPTYGDEQGEGDEAFQEVVYEEAVCEYVFWRDFRHGPARRWVDVTWIAFRSYMTKKEVKSRFNTTVAMDYKPSDAGEDDEKVKKAVIWEIWDKQTKKVIWIAESEGDRILDKKAPMLNLKEFFPVPRPLYSLVTNDKLIPVPDFVEYQDQADELDEISGRIGALVGALKVVGIYAGDAAEVAQMLDESAENRLIPIDNWAMFAERGGLNGVIDWFPIEQVGKVLLGLYQARDNTKEELYEITGLSDILRGASNANETATAQKIKGQFASLRLGDRQKQVSIYARDLLRLVGEVVSEQFSTQTLQMMTGLEHSPEEWEQIMGLLRSDPLRTYRIDIETESTIKVDEEAEKASRLEFVTTIGEFLQGAVPFVQENPGTSNLVGEMLMFAIRGFKVGRQLEGVFEEAVEGLTKQGDDPALMQAQQMIQELQGQLQELMQGREGEMYELEKVTKITDIETKRAENQAKAAEIQAKQGELAAKGQESQAKNMETIERLRIENDTAQADIQLKNAQAIKVSEEARAQDIENDAVESGITDLVEGGGLEDMQARADESDRLREEAEHKCVEMEERPEGPKTIVVTRTDEGLVGVITDAEGNERKAVVNSTDGGMVGTVEGENG